MAYARASPSSFDSHEGWDRRDPKMDIKPYPASSRTTPQQSQSHSIASVSNHAQDAAHYEASARTYYKELHNYLSSVIARENQEGPASQRVAARQKLTQLSALQFHELATDAYDETRRRNQSGKPVPFLPVVQSYHQRRNQARQKLATLPVPRFQDLASDIYFELTRRFPGIGERNIPHHPSLPTMSSGKSDRHNENKEDTPVSKAQASLATNIVPTKGTINIETFYLTDEEKGYRTQVGGNSDNGRTSPLPTSGPMPKNANLGNKSASEDDAQSLDGLMADLENMTALKNVNKFTSSQDSASDENYNSNPRNDWNHKQDELDRMRKTYESKLATMTEQMQQLENESQAVKAQRNSEQSEIEQDMVQLRKLENEHQSRLKRLQDEYNRLDEDHQQLEREHRDLENTVNEVKEDTRQLLEKIKMMSRKNDVMLSDKEQAEIRANQLAQEAKLWQEKYEKTQYELRSLKVRHISKEEARKGNFLQPSPTGAISHNHIIVYQTAVDHLLKAARSSKPSDVLFSMQGIVTVCKKLSADVETFEAREKLSANMQRDLNNAKSGFSNNLTHLLAAAKKHASNMGLSPVRFVDVAAGDLTMSIVDLVKLLGMAPGKDSDDDSSCTTRKEIAVDGVGAMDPETLTHYLQVESDNIVKKAQQLTDALRSPTQNDKVHHAISAIVQTVADITRSTEKTTLSGAGVRFRKPTKLVLSDLHQCSQRLSEIRDNFFTGSATSASASIKQDLTNAVCEIAKYTKEIISIINA